MIWKPSLGTWTDGDGVTFRVWAPEAKRVEVVPDRIWKFPAGQIPVASIPEPKDYFSLKKAEDGTFGGELWAGADFRYRFLVDGRGPFPDPASRFQPEGIHGPSEVVDPRAFRWTDQGWRGIDRDTAVLYELHVGTFTPEGTFKAASKRLAELADLGVTAVQLMPVNDFPGRWNWGYDGVALFAPARCYGRPDDLRRLVDRAHSFGMAMLLDVVYNHFGPDGNYTTHFSPFYVDPASLTNWGPAINLGGEGSAMVRAFFIENARMWLHEYHFDGFRLDATHAFVDDGPRPFLEEFSEAVRASVPDRKLILIAEDHRNLDKIIRPTSEAGWDFDGVWADDFHHEMRRYLTGDSDGVFQDFQGTLPEVATTINRGWLFTGQYSAYREKDRGTDPSGIPSQQFVFCLQNHDRVGNRAGGRRLNHDVDPATYRAATVALLCSPETPMLFMGQEWGATSPFFYFTDHEAELGKAVREGRSREFRKYADFNDPQRLATIPDPQDHATFLASKLDRDERFREPHASILRLYRTLLRLRRDEPAFRRGEHESKSICQDGLLIRLGIDGGSEILVVIRLKWSGDLVLPSLRVQEGELPKLILTTEDPLFTPERSPIHLDTSNWPATVRFQRPGAMIIRSAWSPRG